MNVYVKKDVEEKNKTVVNSSLLQLVKTQPYKYRDTKVKNRKQNQLVLALKKM